jgi:hypothetical protein
VREEILLEQGRSYFLVLTKWTTGAGKAVLRSSQGLLTTPGQLAV